MDDVDVMHLLKIMLKANGERRSARRSYLTTAQ